ncbi:hypothetical protein [Nocardioides psychrotolerans]|uniref:hypothetical protein n=1 Tax=Nocardioides psychrotolerans TaxID=1005945 RepID=UPI0031384194
MTDDDPKLEIDWVKTAAGALAAVSTAVLLSTLGAVGTLIGAALGSVAVTVTSQLYAQGLARSRRSLAKAQETALLKVGIAQAEVRRAGRRQGDDLAVEAHLDMADERLGEAKADLDDAAAAPPTLRERLVVLPWKRIAALTAATFLVVLLAIASFEALTGRSVSSYTGGSGKDSSSTFTGGGSSSSDDDEQRPDRQPSDGATEPTQDPTDGASDEPTEDPSDVPSEDPSATPTEEPTEPVDPTPTDPLPTDVDPTLPAPTPTPTPSP